MLVRQRHPGVRLLLIGLDLMFKDYHVTQENTHTHTHNFTDSSPELNEMSSGVLGGQHANVLSEAEYKLYKN